MNKRRLRSHLFYYLLFIFLSFNTINSFADVIVDNGAPTGTWQVSGGAQPYGSDSLWSRNGATYTWQFDSQPSGIYEVLMWWSAWHSRATDIAVDINYRDGQQTVPINQQENTGQWNSLGEYYFDSTGSVTITAADGSTVSTCADAVWFRLVSENTPPAAHIDSITPNPADPGEPITFTGHGTDTDTDGSITTYQWESSIDGPLSDLASFTTSSLPEGAHTISFKVRDNEGIWSDAATEVLVVGAIPTEIITDNRDTETSQTGTWSVSGGADPYGADSVWSRDGSTFTWSFTPLQSGQYQVAAWWTEWSSRSTNVPVEIHDSTGRIIATVYINQQQNGGQWNSIGAYSFESDVSYNVTITAQPGPSSTCADAVKFSFMEGVLPPTAIIDSMTPNPAEIGQRVTFSGHGEDDGTIEAYSWHSSIDGPLSDSASFDTSALSEGTHTIFFKVQDDQGAWSSEVSETLVIVGQVATTEPIYVCFGYNWENLEPLFISMLQNIGAYKEGDLWIYRNDVQDKTYPIHFIEDIESMKQALKTEGAHIIYTGHSNYGLGSAFATPDEVREQVIEDIRYIDDDRIFNYSSPWIHVSIGGMRTGQAYPDWWPIFKDGTSGIMPYDFGDPNGDPPYNYYLTYQVPGDPTYHKVETVPNSGVERFYDSYSPAWYSPDGTPPDPTNPDHLKYYITNPEPWYPSFESMGDWIQSQTISGYFKENYLYLPAGQGDNQVEWIFNFPEAGDYKVFAWWSASPSRTSNAPYTVNHSLESTTVEVDQRVNGGQWNEIGEFYFDAEEYSVMLTDDADAGNVIADAVRIAHADNPPDIVQADFRANIRSGSAPLEVYFINQGTGDLTGRLWNFGDGYTNSTRDYITHTYTEPGTYTVSLTVTGPLGSNTKTKENYITVGDTTVLQAEFSSSRQMGETPLEVSFRDRSSGDIISWFWEFGDDSDDNTSDKQDPMHTYSKAGNYTVRLTVTDGNGNSSTETKENFVRAIKFDKILDNVDYPKRHYRSKTILFRKELEIPKEELKYDRMLYDSCNTANYYIDTFNRGIMFYTLTTSGSRGSLLYLRAYLEGKSDNEIWEIIQDYEPAYDYYDFNKLPSEQ